MHARLAQADRGAAKWMADKNGVRDMDMRQHSFLDDCFPGIDGSMTITPMPSKIHVKPSIGAVIHTNVMVMSVPSISGASYFVTLIDKSSRQVRAFHMKFKPKAAALLKCQVCCFERQFGCTVKETVLNGGIKYTRARKILRHRVLRFIILSHTWLKRMKGSSS